jgi:hypothetical protein
MELTGQHAEIHNHKFKLPDKCKDIPGVVHTHKLEITLRILKCCPHTTVISISRKLEDRVLSDFFQNRKMYEKIWPSLSSREDWLGFLKAIPTKLETQRTASRPSPVMVSHACVFFEVLSKAMGLRTDDNVIPFNQEEKMTCLKKGDFGITHSLIILRYEDIRLWPNLLHRCLGLPVNSSMLEKHNVRRRDHEYRWFSKHLQWSTSDLESFHKCDTHRFFYRNESPRF